MRLQVYSNLYALFPCFMLELGVRIPALMSCSGSVLAPCQGFGHSCSMFCLVVWACGLEFTPAVRFSVHVSYVGFCVARGSCSATCFSSFLVLLHAVHVFIGCMLSCYVLSCAVLNAACVLHWLHAFMLACLVWTRSLWVFSLAACSTDGKIHQFAPGYRHKS